MRKCVDITEKRFGLLTAKKIIKTIKKYGAVWECICECGRTVNVLYGNLKWGHTTSCGCNSIRARTCPICNKKTTENKCLCGFNFIVNTSEISKDTWYIMGFLLADGCISSRGKKRKDEMTLICELKNDKDNNKILNFIKNKMCPWINIKEYEKKYKNKYYKSIRMFVDIDSENVKDFKKYGIIQNKSLKGENIPNVPNKFFGSWLRGFFDGDGCIHNMKAGNRLTFAAGNKIFLINLSLIIDKYLNIKSTIINMGKPNCFLLSIYKTNDIKKIAKIMYEEKNIICLDRKRIIFEKRSLL